MANKNIDELRELIRSTKGRFTTVEFVKQNGELRKMRIQMGVKKFDKENPRICVNGTSDTTAHIPKYLRVYEPSVDGMRTINLETIKSIKCGKSIQYEAE